MLVNKVTHGYVIQTFDTDTKRCIRQEFKSDSGETFIEDEVGNQLSSYIKESTGADDLYHPFDMKRPAKGKV